MQNRILPLSLLISAALAIPSLAMAAPTDTAADMNADMNAMPVENTVQEEAVGPNGELIATQPGYVESSESATATELDADTQAAYAQYNDPNYQAPEADVNEADVNSDMPAEDANIDSSMPVEEMDNQYSENTLQD